MRRQRGLVIGLGLALCVLCGLAIDNFDGLRTATASFPPLPRMTSASPLPATRTVGWAGAPTPARITMEGGRVLIRLTEAERSRLGIETAQLTARNHAVEIQAFGTVLDIARVTELTNSYANAKAQLQTAEAKAEVSRSAYLRAKNLGQYATQVQVETSVGTFRTDEAALAAAHSQLRTLAATAQQEWGVVIGKAIIERSPIVTRLIERSDFLVQVTLPPGERLKGVPVAAFAEIPPQSERVMLRYVSVATRTDQRIQGISYFYSVAGDSGLLPGMSTLAFLTSERQASGVAVPESAVVHWQGGAWIYRGVGGDAFARHPLKADAPISDDRYVVDDLGTEAAIVVTGPQAMLTEEVKGQSQGAAGDDDD